MPRPSRRNALSLFLLITALLSAPLTASLRAFAAEDARGAPPKPSAEPQDRAKTKTERRRKRHKAVRRQEEALDRAHERSESVRERRERRQELQSDAGGSDGGGH